MALLLRSCAMKRRGAGGLIAFFLALLLAGCSSSPDAEQETLCRRLLPALIDTAAGVAVSGADSARTGEVFVRFTVAGDAREHSLYCRFAGSGLALSKRELLRVALDGAPVSDAAVFILKDRWLATIASITNAPDAAHDDALPVPRLSHRAAYALQQALSALPRTGIIVLVAAAYALLYGLIGRINLAFGAYAALGGIGAVLTVNVLDALGVATLPWGLALGGLMALGLAALYGAVAARVLIVPLAERPGQHLLIASAGLLITLEEFLRLSQGVNTRWLSPVLNAPVTVARSAGFEVTITRMALITALAAALVALALLIHLKRSRFGLRWRAVSDEAGAAALFGIDTARVLAQTFALASGLAGLAGVLVAVHYGGIGFAGGAMLGLTALVAAVLGGIGSVGGAMLGGLIIGALEALWTSLFASDYREVAIFLLLAVLLAVKPDGLLAGRQPGSMRV